jgi:hypothetical protein
MLNICGIVAAILKMATGKQFSMLGIWPPQYRKNSTFFDFKGSF